MKAKDIRTMDAGKRNEELEALRKELFNLRMQKATGQLANNARVTVVRRDIARLKTVANEQKGKTAS
ncbi:MAG: 50S ribosomal protein L29 [Candidatus Muproteobacteria bacterium RBG_16_62_13]|uniref:Large ribosomal subunit protein uL29 n=1 Tax=Candidatus Muproteobacteria bacterium RBG_16_62_13 TaxID=1817756 RepID=A0A1F6T7P6_9PROT|nr:MAG: 50S ribosomal protein L29 [Candidatus Muproteobacteria bacterium RBG_16_62_13]